MKHLIYIFLAFFTLSCSTSKSESTECIDNMLSILDMEAFTGDMDSDCKNYLRWFTHDGDDYFMMDNPCADIALHLWDCDKIDLCQSELVDCQDIIANSTAQGIVGRSE